MKAVKMENNGSGSISPQLDSGLRGDINFASFERPILDDLSCSINLREFHSLNADEVEANLLTDCLKTEESPIGSDNKKLVKSEAQVIDHKIEATVENLGDIFFKHENDCDEHVKLEFDIDTEEISDQDFCVANAIRKEHTDDLLQVEVYSTPISEDTTQESVAESIGHLSSIIETNLKIQECLDIKKEEECIFKVDEHPQLSNIMSDHNYTSQAVDHAADTDIRENIISHILGKNRKFNDSTAINVFIDEIIERINKFQPASSKIETSLHEDRDTFLENILDTVDAEDAAEEVQHSSSSFIQSKCTASTVSNEANSINDDDAVKEEHERENPSTETNGEAGNTNPVENNNLPQSEKTVVENHSQSTDVEAESEMLLKSQSFILPDDCSEPMEHDISFEVTLEHLQGHNSNANCIEEAKPNEQYTEILNDLTAFAKTLHNDCMSFGSASTNIEEKLQRYIKAQFDQFRLLTHAFNQTTDECLQTDLRNSKRKLKIMNLKNKRSLLQSSDTSERSAASTEDSTSSESESPTVSETVKTNKTTRTKRDRVIKTKTDVNAATSSCNGRLALEYDDGVPLSNYIQSDVFEIEHFSSRDTLSSTENLSLDTEFENEDCKKTESSDKLSNKSFNESIAQNESDKENAVLKLTSASNARDKSKDKSQNCSDSEDDKEIERLINLNGLSKRTTYSGTPKLQDPERIKAKIQNQKQKLSLMELMQDELQKGSGSDENISESEEEVITEKQYLARYNEDLKQQLLHSSSSDSENFEHSDDEMLSDGADDDETGNKSPLIEKFLKTFNIEESDEGDEPEENDENEDVSEALDLHEVKCATTDNENKKENETETENDNMDEGKKSLVNSTDNSDCELLNDHLKSRKHSKPKSLEKMLSEADKRRKTTKIDDDLISLSSESESSDVEAIDADQADTNSRIIKPMLRQDQLASETRKAQKNETDRIRRLEKKQTSLAKLLKEHPEETKNGELILDYNEETKTFIKVHPEIVKHLKPHQIDGVKFMYDSCYGGVEALKKSGGSGCILAHCMGLGKTLQLIALLHTVISYKELKTIKILVLCPKSTVMNWADEIVRWLGPLNARNLKVFTFNDTSDINEKLSVLKEWSQSTLSKAGCLLIGYEAFRTLVFYHSYKNRGNVSTARLEDIRDKVIKYLLNPGADLVVCDEGHIIKNSKSAISLAVTKIITPKRIILTGTPIQNNLKEYYSMVHFIKPLFLGTEREFANLYANPIKNGQHKDSSKRDIKVMKQRSFVLHKKLSKFVQRKEAELLKSFLPRKFEYVLFVPMTKIQNILYEHILAAIARREDNRGRGLITDYTCLRKIWTHPKVLEDAWKNATNQKYKKDLRKNLTPHSDDDQPDDIYDSQTGVMSVTNDWWRYLLAENDLETIMPSNKLRTMFEILRMSEDKGEKCLIFSAFVAVLNVVEHFFKKITARDRETLKELNILSGKTTNTWISGQDYYRLDGKTPKSLRHEMIKRFNSSVNKRARVFLISAKAGGQGINLTGANRVIILDTSWNPSNDQQNIFRIFRLGQKKNCYIYRLLAMGTMEEKVYSRSVTKQAMSFRVVDEQQIDRHYNMAELAELYTLTTPNFADRPMPVFPQDSILASLLLNHPEMVYKYHEHDSLLENKVEQELSEQEKADAWAAYERDLNSEIRTLPNMEELQNSFAASKMPNYMSGLAGLDMQTLLNYSSLGQQATPSPYAHSLLSQYNYQATHQQYIDMLNLYRKYAQSSMAYPEMNKSLGDTPYSTSAYASALNALQKGMPSATSLLAGLHGSNSVSNPLSALGDLSMYGIGAPKTGNTTGNLPSHSALHNPISNATAALHSSPPVNPLLQYKQFESSFHNLYNYTNDYSSCSNNGTNAAHSAPKYAHSGHQNTVNPYISTSPYQTPPLKPLESDHSSRQEQLPYMRAPPVSCTSSISPLPMATLPVETLKKPPEISKANKSASAEFNSVSVLKKNDTKPTQNKMSAPPNTTSVVPMESQKVAKPQNVTTKSSAAMPQNAKYNFLPPSSTASISGFSGTPQNGNPIATGTTALTAMKPQQPAKTTPSSTTLTNTATKTNTTSNMQRGLNMGISYPKDGNVSSVENVAGGGGSAGPASVNMGIIYPNSKTSTMPAVTASSSGTGQMKRSSEMQIIPTSNPPGTVSVSKQYNAMSPSISLTALNNKNSIATKTFVMSGKQTGGTDSKTASASYNFAKNSTNNGNSNNTINKNLAKQNTVTNVFPTKAPTKSSSISTVTNAGGTSLNTSVNTSTSSSANSKAKTNIISNSLKPLKPSIKLGNTTISATPTSIVKKTVVTAGGSQSNAAALLQSNYESNSSILRQQKKNLPAAATITPVSTIKKCIIKKPTNATLRGTSSPIPLGATTSSTSSPSSSLLATSQHSNSRQNSTGNIKILPKPQTTTSLGSSNASNTGVSTYLTPMQLQKRTSTTTAAPTTSASVSAVKNSLSIRAVESKQSSAGTGIYIIEANINDKRVAIGAPNKSGGGTTITKVGLKKRKVHEVDIMEAKRIKKN